MTDTGCLLTTIDEEMGENWPRPFGLRWKSGHTSLSSSTVGPPQPSDSSSSGPIFTSSATHQGSLNRP